jgi:hypothetical protein
LRIARRARRVLGNFSEIPPVRVSRPLHRSQSEHALRLPCRANATNEITGEPAGSGHFRRWFLHLGQLHPETGLCGHPTIVGLLSRTCLVHCRQSVWVVAAPPLSRVSPAIAGFTRVSYTAAPTARSSRFGPPTACRDFTPRTSSATASRALLLSSENGERRTDTIRSSGRARRPVHPAVPSCGRRTCGAEARSWCSAGILIGPAALAILIGPFAAPAGTIADGAQYRLSMERDKLAAGGIRAQSCCSDVCNRQQFR